MIDKSFGKKILKYKEDILRDTATLMKIPSVVDVSEATQDIPFGVESKRALEWTLNRAEELGFKTVNVCNKAGHAEYGEGGEIAAVATHVDIVPVGEGWDQDPYELVEKNQEYRGRGLVDDKGPAIITLYCLKVLKDEGIVGKRRMRAIFGAGEEITSDDLDTYFRHEQMPEMSFTPDAQYGICNAEKGIMRLKFEDSAKDNGIIKELKGGIVANSVPSRAEAKLSCSKEEYEQLKEISKELDCEFDFKRVCGGVNIASSGVAAHAMEPQSGKNAISNLIELICRVFGKDKVGKLTKFLNEYIGLTYNGELFGLKMEDEPSGCLTMNLGIVNIGNDCAEATIDIRFPVTAKKSEIFDKIFATAEENGICTAVLREQKALYLPKDMPLMSILGSAYKNITGKEANIFSMGGGTYARGLNGTGVAFGPCFSGDNRIHDVGEKMSVEEFWTHAQICLQAMYEMLMAD